MAQQTQQGAGQQQQEAFKNILLAGTKGQAQLLRHVVGQDLPLNTMFSDVAEVTTWKGMQIPGLILLRDSYAPSHGLDTNLYSVALVTGYEGSVGRAHDKRTDTLKLVDLKHKPEGDKVFEVLERVSDADFSPLYFTNDLMAKSMAGQETNMRMARVRSIWWYPQPGQPEMHNIGGWWVPEMKLTLRLPAFSRDEWLMCGATVCVLYEVVDCSVKQTNRTKQKAKTTACEPDAGTIIFNQDQFRRVCLLLGTTTEALVATITNKTTREFVSGELAKMARHPGTAAALLALLAPAQPPAAVLAGAAAQTPAAAAAQAGASTAAAAGLPRTPKPARNTSSSGNRSPQQLSRSSPGKRRSNSELAVAGNHTTSKASRLGLGQQTPGRDCSQQDDGSLRAGQHSQRELFSALTSPPTPPAGGIASSSLPAASMLADTPAAAAAAAAPSIIILLPGSAAAAPGLCRSAAMGADPASP